MLKKKKKKKKKCSGIFKIYTIPENFLAFDRILKKNSAEHNSE